MILGIDPGFYGGAALVDSATLRLIQVIDMPLTESSGKKLVDLPHLSFWLDMYSKDIDFAVIEDVGVMTGREGVVGMFRFGQAAGGAAGVVAGHHIPAFYVRPATWKSVMNLSRDKDDSRRLASKYFPDSVSKWARKKDDGRAEAALLALYGAKRVAGAFDKMRLKLRKL